MRRCGGKRSKVRGRWGDGVIDPQRMRNRCPNENTTAAFWDFSTLRPGFKKVLLQALRFQDPFGRSAKMMQNMCVYTQKRFHVDGPLLSYLNHQRVTDRGKT